MTYNKPLYVKSNMINLEKPQADATASPTPGDTISIASNKVKATGKVVRRQIKFKLGNIITNMLKDVYDTDLNEIVYTSRFKRDRLAYEETGVDSMRYSKKLQKTADKFISDSVVCFMAEMLENTLYNKGVKKTSKSVTDRYASIKVKNINQRNQKYVVPTSTKTAYCNSSYVNEAINWTLCKGLNILLCDDHYAFNQDDKGDNVSLGYKLNKESDIKQYFSRHLIDTPFMEIDEDPDVPFTLNNGKWDKGGEMYDKYNNYTGTDKDILQMILHINKLKIAGIKEYYKAPYIHMHNRSELGINPIAYSNISSTPKLVRLSMTSKTSGEDLIEVDMSSAAPTVANMLLHKRGYDVSNISEGSIYQKIADICNWKVKVTKKRLLTWYNLDGNTKSAHRVILNDNKRGFNMLEGALRQLIGNDALEYLIMIKESSILYKAYVHTISKIINSAVDYVSDRGGEAIPITDCIIVPESSLKHLNNFLKISKGSKHFKWTKESLKGGEINKTTYNIDNINNISSSSSNTIHLYGGKVDEVLQEHKEIIPLYQATDDERQIFKDMLKKVA